MRKIALLRCERAGKALVCNIGVDGQVDLKNGWASSIPQGSAAAKIRVEVWLSSIHEVEARSLRTEQCHIKRIVMGKTDIEAYTDPRTERCRELARDGADREWQERAQKWYLKVRRHRHSMSHEEIKARRNRGTSARLPAEVYYHPWPSHEQWKLQASGCLSSNNHRKLRRNALVDRVMVYWACE